MPLGWAEWKFVTIISFLVIPMDEVRARVAFQGPRLQQASFRATQGLGRGPRAFLSEPERLGLAQVLKYVSRNMLGQGGSSTAPAAAGAAGAGLVPAKLSQLGRLIKGEVDIKRS